MENANDDFEKDKMIFEKASKVLDAFFDEGKNQDSVDVKREQEIWEKAIKNLKDINAKLLKQCNCMPTKESSLQSDENQQKSNNKETDSLVLKLKDLTKSKSNAKTFGTKMSFINVICGIAHVACVKGFYDISLSCLKLIPTYHMSEVTKKDIMIEIDVSANLECIVFSYAMEDFKNGVIENAARVDALAQDLDNGEFGELTANQTSGERLISYYQSTILGCQELSEKEFEIKEQKQKELEDDYLEDIFKNMPEQEEIDAELKHNEELRKNFKKKKDGRDGKGD